MRIACVHIPQFALQCVTRLDPSLRRAAVVVVGSGLDPAAGTVARVALHSPIVHACSRAAWALGVRLGMTATAARALSPEIRIVTADAQLERECMRAIADVLLGAAATVDLGGRVGAGGAHLAMYCDVPAKTRGTSFGDRLIEMLDELGLAARIGIADDRFTAWVAASYPKGPSASDSAAGPSDKADKSERSDKLTLEAREHGVLSVPRGGSAAFLAPRPLSLLAISPEVQHMLEALGVRTLGEFAALPAPSMARPQVAAAGADYQALARGESGNTLRPYTPEASIREDLVTSDALGGPTALAMLGSRLALRLAGRSRNAARLEIVIANGNEAGRPETAGASGTTGGVTTPRVIAETLDESSADATELAEVIAAAVGDSMTRGARVRVIVTGEALVGANDAVSFMDISSTGSGATLDLVPTVLGVVLANTGSHFDTRGSGAFASWQLSPSGPSLERREGHRRTRRGKQRRRAVPMAQSRLFKVDG